MEQHTIILILAVIVFICSIWLAYKGSSNDDTIENYAFNSVTSMTPAQVQAAMGQQTCASATATLCAAAKGQNLSFPTKDLSSELSDVATACGPQFPVYGVCAASDPNFGVNLPMVLGGTNVK